MVVVEGKEPATRRLFFEMMMLVLLPVTAVEGLAPARWTGGVSGCEESAL